MRSTALQALTSLAWMLPSHQKPGLSSGAPVRRSVTVAHQMSRPSWLLPMLSTALADALHGDVVRVGGHELVQEVGDFLVLEVAVVGDRHGGHGAEITAEVARFEPKFLGRLGIVPVCSVDSVP